MSNTPGASKKAAREAIDRARKASKEAMAAASTASLKDSLLRSHVLGEIEGRDALSNLKRLRGGKLPEGDEVTIARRLYGEVQSLKRHLKARGISLSKFCEDSKLGASGSSKELHRLILAPDQEARSAHLRKSADKYYKLIDAISKHGNRSLDQLADEVLRGTALHPAEQLESMSEAEKLAQALQSTVDKIDKEFGLYEKFMQVAEIKATAVRAGSKLNWPLFDLNLSTEDEYISEIQLFSNAKNCYWGWLENKNREFIIYSEDCFPNNQIISINPDEEFFHIPHAAIGIIETANIKRKPKEIEKLPEYEECIKKTINDIYYTPIGETQKNLAEWTCELISDNWNEEQKIPKGQFYHDNEIGEIGGEFAWLIIYPDQNNSKLIPMLYMSYYDGMPYLLPLNARNIEILKEAIWLNATEWKSAFDRIKDLLGYLPGQQRVIEERLRYTAPWFDHNPIFKAERKKKEDLAALDHFCTTLWQETAALSNPNPSEPQS